MNSIKLENIVGVWKLKEFSVLDENENIIPWSGSCHGHLIYTEDLYVSACINRVVNGERKDSLYFAKVEILENGHIKHHLLESSIVSLIGKIFDRYAELQDGKLILRGLGPSGSLKITWSRC